MRRSHLSSDSRLPWSRGRRIRVPQTYHGLPGRSIRVAVRRFASTGRTDPRCFPATQCRCRNPVVLRRATNPRGLQTPRLQVAEGGSGSLCPTFSGWRAKGFLTPRARFAELTVASLRWISARSCARVASKTPSPALPQGEENRKALHTPEG